MQSRKFFRGEGKSKGVSSGSTGLVVIKRSSRKNSLCSSVIILAVAVDTLSLRPSGCLGDILWSKEMANPLRLLGEVLMELVKIIVLLLWVPVRAVLKNIVYVPSSRRGPR
uniref:Uncharacterized protein n=1 Tax=Magallana gigas TaxID=29159 RepID=A0A8W8HNA8_MAGGI